MNSITRKNILIRYLLISCCLGLLLFASSCIGSSDQSGKSNNNSAAQPPKSEDIPAVLGAAAIKQKIYVPVYSHIYHGNMRTINLAATLTIHNTDTTKPIALTSVGYYDTNGKLVRNYIKQPIQILPMATKDYVVEEDDLSGGVGANFLVEWQAGELVTEPIVEAVMIGTQLSQGISFTSSGRVIESQTTAAPKQ